MWLKNFKRHEFTLHSDIKNFQKEIEMSSSK